MTTNQALLSADKKLKENSKTPRLDAEVFLSYVLKKPREWLLAHPDEKLTELQIKNYKLKITRRIHGEPVAYITGKKDFYGLSFSVSKSVLIPRPETELMVELGLKELRNILRNKIRNSLKNEKVAVVDVGTGSGCVVISIADQLKVKSQKLKVEFIGIDISKDALKIAKKNARQHGVKNKITFLQGNLLEPVTDLRQLPTTSYQLLVTANLPYVSEELYKKTKKDVQDFEPRTALISGQDGLDHYRKLFDQIKALTINYPAKRDPGTRGKLQASVLCEISPEQKEKIKKEIIKRFPEAKIKFHKDLAGKWRLVEFSF